MIQMQMPEGIKAMDVNCREGLSIVRVGTFLIYLSGIVYTNLSLLELHEAWRLIWRLQWNLWHI